MQVNDRGFGGVYPRVCGGTPPQPPQRDLPEGLSPRVRGNQALIDAHAGAGGSIPACAGEPHGMLSDTRYCEVYPRVCGGTDSP